jgi:hypothetical protein
MDGRGLRNFATRIGVLASGKYLASHSMDRKAEETPQGQRKIVIILSDRSREIIRLFEERRQKRQQAGNGSPGKGPGRGSLIIAAIGLAVIGIAEFIRPMPSREPAVTLAAQQPAVPLSAQEPVRIVGPAFVPNLNPREH